MSGLGRRYMEVTGPLCSPIVWRGKSGDSNFVREAPCRNTGDRSAGGVVSGNLGPAYIDPQNRPEAVWLDANLQMDSSQKGEL